jgi:phosphoribosylanthranilate isomerase
MKVKICGLTRETDVEAAIGGGATHLGCVLAPESPRAVKAADAGALIGDPGTGVTAVLVFRGATCTDVQAAVDVSGIGTVQLHRHAEEDAVALEAAGLTVIRARDVGSEIPAGLVVTERCPILLDVDGGGSGRSFDWTLLGGISTEHVFVAGGITPENVGQLLDHDPWGIDISSGIESSPGIKDLDRLRALFAAIEKYSGRIA